MNEIFKDLKDYEGLYQVSNCGRVLSLAKGDGNGNKDRILKQAPNVCKHGTYYYVSPSKNGKARSQQVHRLVAQAFLPNPENKPHVNHIDNDPSNNHVDNLEWCTHSENMLHAHRQGRLDATIAKANKANTDNHQLRAEKRFSALLGDKFISTQMIPNTKGKRSVTYNCKHCNTVYTTRHDSPILGRCRNCKEEEIV